MAPTIRAIQPADNPHLANIIRNTLAEFGLAKPGTVFTDPTTNALFELFQTPGSYYQVVIMDGLIVGGAGIFPSHRLPAGTCELVKMYLIPGTRGQGLGKLLIEKCLKLAKEFGYQQVYIESFPELKKAVSVYQQFGFEFLPAPMGNTGHFGCNVWMLKKL